MLKAYHNAFGFVYFTRKCWSFVSFWVTVTLLELETFNASFPWDAERDLHDAFFFPSYPPTRPRTSSQPALFPRTRLHSVAESKGLLKRPTCPQFTGTKIKPRLHQKHAWGWNMLITINFRYESVLNMGEKVRAGLCPLSHFSGPKSGNSLGPTSKERLVDYNLKSQNDTRC